MLKTTPKPDIEHFKKFHLLDMMSARHLNYLREKSLLCEYQPGDVLFSPPRSSSMGFYLIEGVVAIHCDGQETRCVCAGTEESYHSIEEKLDATARAVAVEPCTVMQLSRVLVEQYFSWSTTGQYRVVDIQALNSTLEKQQTEWMKPLLHSPLLKNLDASGIDSLFASFEDLRVREGDVLLHQGERATAFCVIKSGSARLKHANGDISLLHVGSYFGDDSLVPNAASSVQVEMQSQGVIAKLTREHFQRFIAPSVLQRISLEQVLRLDAEKILWLDVRFAAEFGRATSPNIINIPLNTLARRLAELPRDRILLLTPESGARGELAAYQLLRADIRAYVIGEMRTESRSA